MRLKHRQNGEASPTRQPSVVHGGVAVWGSSWLLAPSSSLKVQPCHPMVPLSTMPPWPKKKNRIQNESKKSKRKRERKRNRVSSGFRMALVSFLQPRFGQHLHLETGFFAHEMHVEHLKNGQIFRMIAKRIRIRQEPVVAHDPAKVDPVKCRGLEKEGDKSEVRHSSSWPLDFPLVRGVARSPRCEVFFGAQYDSVCL